MLAHSDDPLARVFELDSRTWKRGLAIGLCGALLIHAAAAGEAARLASGMGSWALDVRTGVNAYLSQLYNIEVVAPPKPPPPEPPAPEQKAQAPTSIPRAVSPATPRPAPAQAAKILTQEPTPDEPVDLTGMGFVTGSAESYAGGVTSGTGTSAKAVQNLNAGPGGVPGGTGTAPAAPGPDLSRAASLEGDSYWDDCAWPAEADAEQIDFQKVQIAVTVRPDGGPQDVKVVTDPGHGFGRAARQCALRKRYNPARDRDGHPMLSTMPPFWVRFTR